MSYQQLLYTVDDRVARITLNRPERLNALSKLLVDEIVTALAEADADPEVRVVVIAGAGGRAFSAGYDIETKAVDHGDHGLRAVPRRVGEVDILLHAQVAALREF